MRLEPVKRNCYRLPCTGKMRVEGLVYARPRLLSDITEDRSLEQLAQAAELPGVVAPVLGMPDIHEGFGLPIGGVMAVTEEESSRPGRWGWILIVVFVFCGLIWRLMISTDLPCEL